MTFREFVEFYIDKVEQGAIEVNAKKSIRGCNAIIVECQQLIRRIEAMSDDSDENGGAGGNGGIRWA